MLYTPEGTGLIPPAGRNVLAFIVVLVRMERGPAGGGELRAGSVPSVV
jgi:hypothetical protein